MTAARGLIAPGTVSFGEDASGRVFVAQIGGQVSRIAPSNGVVTCAPPQGTIPPAAAPVAAPADANGPDLRVDARKARRAAARGKVTVLVGCDEPCTVRGEGKVIVPGRDIRLDPDFTALGPGALGALHLELSRKEARRLRRSLLAGRKPRAAVALVAFDSAGNQAADTRRIRQKR